MDDWRGFASNINGRRVVVNDACWGGTPEQAIQFIHPSPRLLCDAKRYKQKYLKTDAYIAIIARTEKIALNQYKLGIDGCLERTLNTWREMKRRTGLNLTFLSIDVGKYGSTGLQADTRMDVAAEDFLHQLYGPTASVRQWEETFESITDIRDSGYIALLQKSLVVRAQCIIFVGGGSFQKHAKYLYQKLHPGKKGLCMHIVTECTRKLQ